MPMTSRAEDLDDGKESWGHTSAPRGLHATDGGEKEDLDDEPIDQGWGNEPSPLDEPPRGHDDLALPLSGRLHKYGSAAIGGHCPSGIYRPATHTPRPTVAVHHALMEFGRNPIWTDQRNAHA